MSQKKQMCLREHLRVFGFPKMQSSYLILVGLLPDSDRDDIRCGNLVKTQQRSRPYLVLLLLMEQYGELQVIHM